MTSVVVAMYALWIALALSSFPAPQENADFTSFYRQFRTAVAAADGNAIASLTALPFQLDGRQLDSAEFSRRAGELFDDRVRRCLPFADPLPEDDAMTVSCPPYIFYFRVVGGGYRLAEFAADPEGAADEGPPDTAFTTRYDIRAESFSHAWVFGPIAAVLLLLCAVLLARAIRQGRSPRSAVLLLVLTVVLAAGTIGIPYWDRQRLIRQLSAGTTLIAEGPVSAHEAREVRVRRSGEGSRTTARTFEAFEVGGVRFGYYREVDQAGFHNATSQRLELRDGMFVRVRYVEDRPGEAMERRILVIESAGD